MLSKNQKDTQIYTYDDFKIKNGQICSKEMKGLKNRMTHDYAGLDYEVIWEIVTNYIEELEFQIEKLIEKITFKEN